MASSGASVVQVLTQFQTFEKDKKQKYFRTFFNQRPMVISKKWRMQFGVGF